MSDDTEITISTPGGGSVVTSLDGMRRTTDLLDRKAKALTLFSDEREPTRFLLKTKAGETSLLNHDDQQRAMRGRGTTVYLVIEVRIDEVKQKDVFDADGYVKHTVQEHTATIRHSRTVSQSDAMPLLYAEVEADAS